jgi:hypothetical protein
MGHSFPPAGAALRYRGFTCLAQRFLHMIQPRGWLRLLASRLQLKYCQTRDDANQGDYDEQLDKRKSAR